MNANAQQEFPTPRPQEENVREQFKHDETYSISTAGMRQIQLSTLKTTDIKITSGFVILSIVDLGAVSHLMSAKSVDDFGNATAASWLVLLASAIALSGYFLIGELLKKKLFFRLLGVFFYLVLLVYLAFSAGQVYREEIIGLWSSTTVVNVVSNLLDMATSSNEAMPRWFFHTVSLIFGMVYTLPGLGIIILKRQSDLHQVEWALYKEAESVVLAHDAAREKLRLAHLDLANAEAALQEAQLESKAKEIMAKALPQYCKTLRQIEQNNIVNLFDGKEEQAEKKRAAQRAGECLQKFFSIHNQNGG